MTFFIGGIILLAIGIVSLVLSFFSKNTEKKKILRNRSIRLIIYPMLIIVISIMIIIFISAVTHPTTFDTSF